MQYLYILIIMIVLYGLIKNHHNTVIIYAMCSVLFQDYFCIKYTSPALTLHFALDILVIISCFLNKKLSLNKFPLQKTYYFLFFISVVGILVSSIDIIQAISATINIITPYIIVICFNNEIVQRKDLELAKKSMVVVFLILCLYALVEFYLQNNVVGEYMLANYSDFLNGKLYLSHEYRYFSIRCSSLLSISISWGGFCCLFFSTWFCINQICNRTPNLFLFSMIVLSIIFNVVISGSRSPMAYLSIVMLPLFLFSKPSTKVISLILVGVGLFFFSDFLELILSSMSSGSDVVVGSSTALRFDQLSVALSVISQSPIWGFGIKGLIKATNLNSDILGAESIWFQQLINGGILAIVYQVILYITILTDLLKSSFSKDKLSVASFVIGWVVFSSLTSSPGLNEAYFLTMYILIYKCNTLSHNITINKSSFMGHHRIDK